MDIENLTIKEAKEIAFMVSGLSQNNNDNSIYSKAIGKYVIVRSRNEGINAGEVVECDPTGIVLKDAKRLWYHKANGGESWYEGVSQNGLTSDSKVSTPCNKIIVEDYSITFCTEKAKESIINHSNYQS